jgi:hypothetical protein
MLRKLSLLLVALGLAAAWYLPGRAQVDTTGRYAFADSTLLRDTLGLHFGGLFQLADSLEMTPDTLRALSIRYRLRLARLVALADSLHVPVDSVGVTIEREGFNPLAARVASVSAFDYNTTYSLLIAQSTWGNVANYNLVSGPLFVRNTTNIALSRFQATNSVYQTRLSRTEVGWRLSPSLSVGGLADLNRTDSDDPSGLTPVHDKVDRYQFSLHNRLILVGGFTTQLDALLGGLDQRTTSLTKQGLSAQVNARARQAIGRWFTHEVSGRLQPDFAHTQLLANGVRNTAPDFVGGVDGTLTLFNAALVGMRTTYSLSKSDVGSGGQGSPGSVDTVLSRTKQSRASLEAALRTKLGQDGYLNLTQSLSSTNTVLNLNGPSSTRSAQISADGRTTWRGWAVEGRFQTGAGHTERSVGPTSGLAEDSNTRLLEGAMNRRFFQRLIGRLSAHIGLTSVRDAAIGNYGSPPPSRDDGQQSYKIEGVLPFNKNAASTDLSFEVLRDHLVNIPSAATSANNTARTYRAQWHWTYRLLAGLTASQINTLSAIYTSYDFLNGADRATFDFGTNTTLNAVLTPRLSIDLNHKSDDRPSGNWTRLADGFYYLQPSDQSRNFELAANIRYTPSPVLSLNFGPDYLALKSDGATHGVVLPIRRQHTLVFNGTASLNLPVGRGGLLTGTLGRTYRADRTAEFTSGVPAPAPLGQTDYWNASLQFSWKPS